MHAALDIPFANDNLVACQVILSAPNPEAKLLANSSTPVVQV
jgi:hypothetical protein